MNSPDIELLKEIPGFKVIVRAMLRNQMQYLAKQLSDHGGVETVILAASMPDGSLSHIASHGGQGFLDKRDDIMSQFLSHCLTSQYKEGQPQETRQHEGLNEKSLPQQNLSETNHSSEKQKSVLNYPDELHHHQQQNQSTQYDPPHQTSLDQNPSEDYSNTFTVECNGKKGTLSENLEQAAITQETDIPGTSYVGEDSVNDELNIRIESVRSGGNFPYGSSVDCAMETDHTEEKLETTVDLTLEVSDVDSDSQNEDFEISGNNLNEVAIRDFEHIKKKLSEGKDTEGVNPNQNVVVISEMEHMKRKNLSESNDIEDNEQGQNEVVIEFDQEDENDGIDDIEMGTYLNNSSASITEKVIDENQKKSCNEESNICSFCGIKLASKGNYKRHVRKHTGEKPYKCSKCEMGFTRSEYLKKHMFSHSDKTEKVIGTNKKKPCHKESISCSFCGIKFVSKRNYNRHVRKHTGEKPYKCSKCEMGFIRLEYLKKHMFSHSDITEKVIGTNKKKPCHKESISCSFCGIKFASKSNYVRHVRKHTGEKPYKCSKGEKGFNRLGNFKRHLSSHPGETTFQCALCERKFLTRAGLLSHMRKVHKQQSIDIKFSFPQAKSIGTQSEFSD